MAHETKAKHKSILPLNIITVADLGRLGRELGEIEDFSMQASVRDAGQQPKLPRTSKGLGELASQNDLNLLKDGDRQKLRSMLDDLRQHAPVMHISFATDPPASFLARLITWLRNEIHPSVLINVGLQPGIAAGCIVRTTNKYFDLSLRKQLSEQSKLLAKALMEGPSDERQ